MGISSWAQEGCVPVARPIITKRLALPANMADCLANGLMDLTASETLVGLASVELLVLGKPLFITAQKK
ncbi:MAG: hypothetical protein AAGL17_03725, partial [Cyanobacteria bacterium J06576_12]